MSCDLAQTNEVWHWRASEGGVEARFIGRGPHDEARQLLAELGDRPGAFSWLRQVHSARVLEAAPGSGGEGDALWTAEADLALIVVTADCVPILLAGPKRVAAIHAGWRGVASRVVETTVDALGESPETLRAWIGPAIGPCCYEVGHEVASEVEAAAPGMISRPGSRGRPHLDLGAAVEIQLRRSGVLRLARLTTCTRCHEERLHSYRREGRGAGRNRAIIWRSQDARPPR